MGSHLLYVLIPGTAHSTYKNALTQTCTKVLELSLPLVIRKRTVQLAMRSTFSCVLGVLQRGRTTPKSIHFYMCIYSYIHTLMLHAHMHSHRHMHTCTHIPLLHIHTYTYTHSHTLYLYPYHTYTYKHHSTHTTRTYTHTQTHTHTYTPMHGHMQRMNTWT